MNFEYKGFQIQLDRQISAGQHIIYHDVFKDGKQVIDGSSTCESSIQNCANTIKRRIDRYIKTRGRSEYKTEVFI